MPWCHTYAWNGQLDGLVQAIDDSNFQSTYQQFSKFFQGASISKVWNSSNNHWPFPKVQYANPQCTVQSSQAMRINPFLTNLPDTSNMEPQNPQQLTGYQQRATPQTQHLPGIN